MIDCELDYRVAEAVEWKQDSVREAWGLPWEYDVPDYSTDDGAAIAALREFCRSHELFGTIDTHNGVKIETLPSINPSTSDGGWECYRRDENSLAKAISECLIAAHAARKERT